MSPWKKYKVWKVRLKCIRAGRLKTPQEILERRSETYKKMLKAGLEGKKKEKLYYQGMLDESKWILRDDNGKG